MLYVYLQFKKLKDVYKRQYHEFPERIRVGYDNVMLPFVWSDRDKVRWCHDERYCERVVELFTLKERER